MRHLVAGRRRGDHIVFMCKSECSVRKLGADHLCFPDSGHGDQAIPINDTMEEDGMDESEA